jgi:hypothetical protein
MVEENPRSIIITAHHYVLKNTTVASGEWEGLVRDDKGNWRIGYHGYPGGESRVHVVSVLGRQQKELRCL